MLYLVQRLYLIYYLRTRNKILVQINHKIEYKEWMIWKIKWIQKNLKKIEK